MRKLLLFVCLLAGIVLAGNPAIDEISKIWSGSLEIGQAKLKLVVNFDRSDDGNLTATIDSPDQGAYGIPVSKVELDDKKLLLESSAVGGAFNGALSDDGHSIEGTWSQGGMNLPLTLKPSEKEEPKARPQEPRKPYPYNSEDVEFTNPVSGYKIAGTLTYPKEGGPFPAAVLISGSGAEDRNEEVFGHRPFLVLSDYLTREGIAVLRYDDRGVGGSGGNVIDVTSADLATDAAAAVDYLRSREEVDNSRIGLIGHSEGGLIAPMVAVDHPDKIAFIILMAGPGTTGDKIILEQMALISKMDNMPATELAQELNTERQLFDILKNQPNDSLAHIALKNVMSKSFENLTQPERDALGDLDTFADKQVEPLTSAWFRYFISYDPIPTLKKVKCPVLAINGSLDIQVTPKSNLRAIEKALDEVGNPDYTIREYEGLNHLFQPAETGAITEYSNIDVTMSSEVIVDMIDWILAHTNKK